MEMEMEISNRVHFELHDSSPWWMTIENSTHTRVAPFNTSLNGRIRIINSLLWMSCFVKERLTSIGGKHYPHGGHYLAVILGTWLTR